MYMPPVYLQEPKPSKTEQQRLQAKVKPMSTSDEKMMEDAINMANEFASQSSRAQMVRQESLSDKASDQDSGSDSPRLISKLKASIKRSPKRERKRTFSDSLNHDMDDDVPPEAQEAYNMLVVHGSVKDGSRGYQFGSEQIKRESLVSNGSAGHNFAYADSSSSSKSRTPDRESPLKSVSRQSSERSSMSPPNLTRLNSTGAPERPTPRPRPDVPPTIPKRGEIPVPKPRPEVQRVEPTPRPPPPPIPVKDFDTASALSNDSASNNAFDNPLLIKEEDWKNSEESLRSERHSQHLPEERVDSLNTSIDSGRKSTSPSDVSQSSASKFSFFEEEFDQPSPREIMSKLARESRLRRSLDHQRGPGEGDTAPNRNLREPQGIPGKTSLASANTDEEEVDTNPLRMLRGGVIPVRGGRGGSGMSSNKPTLRHPKLHFTTGSSLQHSVSVDAGRERNVSQSDSHMLPEVENESLDSGHSSPPALPPRSFSICDSTIISNPLPLPPRNPRRTVSLSIKPRERKYPLLLDNNTNNNSSCTSPVVGPHRSLVSQSVTERFSTSNSINTDITECDTRVSDLAFNEIILSNEKYSKPFPVPDILSKPCNTLNDTNSSSLAELPQAPPPPPPPPPYQIAVSMEMDHDSDDNVFESPHSSGNFSSAKNVNLSSEGGSSGASTFPRGFKLFGIKKVKCSLEQLGFYNHKDPFWEQNVIIGDQRSLSEQSENSEMDASPLMLAKYKCSEGVSYEDLLDFALDR